jgi:hypothetical protein
MTIIDLKKETHIRLLKYKAECRLSSNDAAVARLLDESDMCDGLKDEWETPTNEEG